MIRLFFGVAIDPEVASGVADLQARLKSRLPDVRWVAKENFHFTLKFLGPVAEGRVAAIRSAVTKAVAGYPAFAVLARGLGVFPDIRRPRVVWVGLHSAELEPLAETVEEALEPLGFGREARPFRPHLTIGRWSSPAPATAALNEALARWREEVFGESRVEEVVLFQSVLKPTGAVYTRLAAAPLGGRRLTATQGRRSDGPES